MEEGADRRRDGLAWRKRPGPQPSLEEGGSYVGVVIGPDGYVADALPELIEGRGAASATIATTFGTWRSTTRTSRPAGSIGSRRGSRCSGGATITAPTVHHRADHAWLRAEPPARRRRAGNRANRGGGDDAGSRCCSGRPVNSYNDGAEHDFADLLHAVGSVDGVRRVRRVR